MARQSPPASRRGSEEQPQSPRSRPEQPQDQQQQQQHQKHQQPAAASPMRAGSRTPKFRDWASI